jgi:hypothetical protein
MPGFLRALAVVGTAAMIWVGGGIILHGIEEFGLGGPAHFVHHLAEIAGQAVPAVGGAVEWLVGAAGAGFVGLVLGLALIPISEHVLAPALRALMALWPSGRGA